MTDKHPQLHVIDGGRTKEPGRRRVVAVSDELPEGVVAEVGADRLAELTRLVRAFEAETEQAKKMSLAADIIVEAKRTCISQDEVRSMREDGEW